MKIAATNYNTRSLNFGRALTSEESKLAASAIQKARGSQGFSDGISLMMIPDSKIPQGAAEPEIAQKLKEFFSTIKNLLGINMVETSEDVEPELSKIIKEEGLGRIKRFVSPEGDLKAAVEAAAKEADGLRIIDPQGYTPEQLDLIEQTFKEVKGDKFDRRLLIYDVSSDGARFDYTNGSAVKEPFTKRMITGSTQWCKSEPYDNTNAYLNRYNVKKNGGDFIMGIGRDGEKSLESAMGNSEMVSNGNDYLKNVLKLADDELKTPLDFAHAKRADVARAENIYRQFRDLMISDENVNLENFTQMYYKALQENKADNFFDSLAKVLKSQDIDQANPELYQEVCKFRNALLAPGPVSAEEAAKLGAKELDESYSFNFVEAQKLAKEKAVAAAKKLEQQKSELKIGEDGFVNSVMNFGRAHKKQVAAVSIGAIVLAAGATLLSYHKEISQKKKAAKPKIEPRLPQ